MIYHFANLIDAEGTISAGQRICHVGRRCFELLRALFRSKQGRLVTKDDLVETVWHGLNVSGRDNQRPYQRSTQSGRG
jgi:DNA-binding winged helix-turn-helix (wHTH) protein